MPAFFGVLSPSTWLTHEELLHKLWAFLRACTRDPHTTQRQICLPTIYKLIFCMIDSCILQAWGWLFRNLGPVSAHFCTSGPWKLFQEATHLECCCNFGNKYSHTNTSQAGLKAIRCGESAQSKIMIMITLAIGLPVNLPPTYLEKVPVFVFSKLIPMPPMFCTESYVRTLLMVRYDL